MAKSEADPKSTGDEPDSVIPDFRTSVREAFEEAGVELSPEKSRIVANLLVGQASSIFQGPLPPPALLRQYNSVVPGLAGQIAEMARAEQKHRHRWEMGALRNDVFTQSGGLLLGWFLAAGCAAGYAALVAFHYSALAAAPLLGPPLLAIIKTMLPGERQAPAAAAPQSVHAPTTDTRPSSTD